MTAAILAACWGVAAAAFSLLLDGRRSATARARLAITVWASAFLIALGIGLVP